MAAAITTDVYRDTYHLKRSPGQLRGLRFFAAACLALTHTLVGQPVYGQSPAFSDQSDAAGLTFVHTVSTDAPGYGMHGGGAAGDFNNDGYPDLFVIGGGLTTDRLFINNGNGTFTDMADSAGVDALHRGVGASTGDYNDDGFLDIFVTSMGDMSGDPANGQHRLYHNNGDLTFTDVAVTAGVNQTADYPDGYGSTWGDYNLDGELDLFVAGWHRDDFNQTQGNRLFRNNGDGTFTDVTVAAGVLNPDLKGFGPILVDMDGDRYPELLVSGDFGTSFYCVNNRDGTFTPVDFLDEGSEMVVAGMGTAVGDFNQDGMMDWFITAIYPAWRGLGADGNRLYMNQGDHIFSELPESAGVNDGGWGWGTVAVDFDHDSWQDIVMTNGWPVCDSLTGECFDNEPSYLFRNNHNHTFTEVGQLYGLDHTDMGRGLLHFDYDVDGDMDIVIFSNQGNLALFRNDLSGPNTNWLEVVLDNGDNLAVTPNGWGASVEIHVGIARPRVFRLNGGSNFISVSEQIAHFGLKGVPMIDEVIINWPDGFRTVLTDVAANQRLEVSAPLPYNHDPLVRGTMVDLTVDGMLPGEKAYFLGSVTGLGEGPCYPFLGDLCVDILSPFLLGSVTADLTGTAMFTLTVPINPSITTVYTQAVIRRGPGGTLSFKSNAIEDELIDP